MGSVRTAEEPTLSISDATRSTPSANGGDATPHSTNDGTSREKSSEPPTSNPDDKNDNIKAFDRG